MTPPTGRPRGRPKTKEYTTLMTRVDLALADRVKRYASLHRQPIAVVIRDALTLLMEEYPAGADRSGPQRLAAHEFLSDRYESPLDTLMGETDSAGLDALLSDTPEEAVETLLAEAMTDRTSGTHTGSAAPRLETPAGGQSRKASDKKAARPISQPTSTAETPSIMSDANAALADGPQHPRGPQSDPLRQRILTLLAEHPEGLSAEEMRGNLQADTPIGETLQDLRKAGIITTRGRGKALRYVVA